MTTDTPTFTEDEIREACKRLPFSFTGEHQVMRDGMMWGEVGGQFHMGQSVDYPLDGTIARRSQENREEISRINLREYLSRHMAALLIAALTDDTETLAAYTPETKENDQWRAEGGPTPPRREPGEALI